uniref:G_PROTEIN_RECEP_F1_2 domain-containing protein n=1 Tax=Panagrellus redivivus TaxID=6233 RepID=A0A7E4VFC8_PANRE
MHRNVFEKDATPSTSSVIANLTNATMDYNLLLELIRADPTLRRDVMRDYLPLLRMASNSNILALVGKGNGTCEDFVDLHPDPTNTTLAMVVFGIIYTHIFVLGLLGNAAIMYLTLRNRHLQTVQNIFILNLAMSDIIVCLLSVPITPVTNVSKTWFFGSYICHLLPFVQAVSVVVSTFSLSAIAIDRYSLVVRPHANLLQPRGAVIVAIILWVLAAVVSMPYCYFMTLEDYAGYCGKFCSEHWPNEIFRRGYTLVLLCFQFLIPFATMSCCYSAIFSHLRERANSKIKKLNERSQLLESARGLPLDNTIDAKETFEYKQKAQLLAKQRRITTILASMVLIFALSWLPHNIISLIIEYDATILVRDTNYTYIASTIAHCIAMTNNVANPVLYAWLNPSFKELLLKKFWHLSHSDKLSTTSGTPATTFTRVQRTDSKEVVVRINDAPADKEQFF